MQSILALEFKLELTLRFESEIFIVLTKMFEILIKYANTHTIRDPLDVFIDESLSTLTSKISIYFHMPYSRQR